MKQLLTILLLTSSLVHGQKRPNILFIMSDDHDADAISAYNPSLLHTPNIDRIAAGGYRFTRSFVGNSICSPSRATVLTGQHSHKHGVKDNRTRFDSSKITLPRLLRSQGYQTALLGKWHLHSLPTGFDHWKIYPGQGLYYNPLMINMNGDTVTEKGYSTGIVTRETISWLQHQRDTGKPFFLMMQHKAPHRNFLPQPDLLKRFVNRQFPLPDLDYDSTLRGAAFREQQMSILLDMTLCSDLKIDPAWIMDIPHLKPDSSDIRNYQRMMARIPAEERKKLQEIYAQRGKLLADIKPRGRELLLLKYQWYMQDYLACIAAVDQSVGAILDYLEQSGLEKETIVIYTSDQGFYLGENGWFDKRFMYDVSMQTPLLIRYPEKIRAGFTSQALVQNIDLAPTMLDLAGMKIPDFMQGISLKDHLFNPQNRISRKALYYHYYEYPYDHRVLPHLGIREDRYKLIFFYTRNEWELYDLELDPKEKWNRVNDPAYAKEKNRLYQELLLIRNFYEDQDPLSK